MCTAETIKLMQAARELSGGGSPRFVLERMVRLAPDVIPGAEHVSVTVVGQAGLVTAAANGALAEQLDAAQYELGEGPCVDAARAGQVVVVADLGVEGRWPGFTTRAAQQPVRSMLALPWRTGDALAGSLNLASSARQAFTPASRAAGLLFAVMAALALTAATAREREAHAHGLAAEYGQELRAAVTAALGAAEHLQRQRAQLDRPAQQALDLLIDELVRQQQVLSELLELRVHPGAAEALIAVWAGAGETTIATPGGVGWSELSPVQDLTVFWDLSPALMVVGDDGGNYHDLNRACLEVLGWAAEELKSAPWWEFLHPDERDELTEAAQRLIERGGARVGDTVRMLCRDGAFRWIRWNTAIDRRRRLFYAAGVDLGPSFDRSDRVTVGTWRWQTASETLSWSPDLAELIIPTVPVMTGRQFLRRVHPEDRAGVAGRARDSRDTGELFTADFRIVGPAGALHWVHAAGRATRDRDGQVNGLHGIAVDATHRRDQDDR